MYTASNETAGVTRDSKIIKSHAVLELEQKLFNVSEVVKLASTQTFKSVSFR